MSIEMKHSERLAQSIDGLRASGCGTIIAIALALLVLAVPCVADADPAWLAAFTEAHAYAPQDDPGLLAQGYTPQEALAEHIAALEWSRGLGHAPDAAEWQARWCAGHQCWRLQIRQCTRQICIREEQVIDGQLWFFYTCKCGG